MIHLPATSTCVVCLGSENAARDVTLSIFPPRTTTTASCRAGPPVPSIRVAPTSAIPSGPVEVQATSAARASSDALPRITRGMIVKDPPVVASPLQDQRERPAGSGPAVLVENE